MEEFSKEIEENLNKNYELFSKNFNNNFEKLAKIENMVEIAEKSGARLIADYLLIEFFERQAVLDFQKRKIFITEEFFKKTVPVKKEGQALDDLEELDVFSSSIILHYLITADGEPLYGEWIQYRDLSDGMFYSETIPGILKPLVLRYEKEGDLLLDHIKKIGGNPKAGFKHAGIVHPFKKFPILIIFEEKDEEFDADIRILFDRSASHYLKTDIIKTILVYMVRKLLKA
jgi:hypothetical protein